MMTSTLRKMQKLARLVAGKGCTVTDFRPVYEGTTRDAWDYTRNPFETLRFDMVAHALSGIQVKKALEVGCAEGHLTPRLAGHAEDLLACDIMTEAISRARKNCADCDNVRFLCVDVRAEWPEEMFDLIVYSDVLYFFSKREVKQVLWGSAQHVNVGGYLLFANEWHNRYRWFTHPSFIMEQLHGSEFWECVSARNYSHPDYDRSVTIGLFRRVSSQPS